MTAKVGPEFTNSRQYRILNRALGATLLPGAIAAAVIKGPAIKREDGGPAVYRTDRLGGYGHATPVTIMKLRSCPVDTPVQTSTKGSQESFRTETGQEISESHMDELLNAPSIVRGEIAAVGGKRVMLAKDEDWILDGLSLHEQTKYVHSKWENMPGLATNYSNRRDAEGLEATGRAWGLAQIEFTGTATFWGMIDTFATSVEQSGLTVVKQIIHHSGMRELAAVAPPVVVEGTRDFTDPSALHDLHEGYLSQQPVFELGT